MGVLLVRRKQLEQALTMAESETCTSLKKRVLDLQTSAKTLLLTKQTVERKLHTTSQSGERQSFVTESVKKAMATAPKEDKREINLVFDQGERPIVEFIENYGSVGVGKRKAEV